MQKKLLLLSFIEGGAVMAAELCGAKLLAPVFGSSLYVWASVMGFTLAALASGYFFGGWLTTKAGERQRLILFRILNAAALFLVLMPVISHYLVPRLSYLPFLQGVVLSTLLLLFPAIFLLGATSPLFIVLQTLQTHESGKVSGTVYAVSTLGGILATFLCGFYLIPDFGLSACLLAAGLLLFVANVVVMKVFKAGHLLVLIAFSYLNLRFSGGSDDCLFSSEGMLGRVEVKDLTDGKNKHYRILTVNDIVQTEMDLETRTSLSEYIKLIDTLVTPGGKNEYALVLGLGGGLAANLLTAKNYHTDGVELDQRILEAASCYFYLDKRVEIYNDDARCFLSHYEEKYSVVVVDVFKGEEQPSHIVTSESLEKLKTRLSDSALLLINWHGYVQGTKGLGTAILLNTLKASGFHVKLCSYSPDEDHRNILIVASLRPLGHAPYELHEVPETTTLVNTDGRPLLENYNAEANKAWRLSYLRYYQSRN